MLVFLVMRKINTKIISTEDVKKVAELSKLTLKKGETEMFQAQLSSILSYVNQIGEMKTKGLLETNVYADLNNVFRNDVIDATKVLSQKEALSCAKRTHNGFFVVKAVLYE